MTGTAIALLLSVTTGCGRDDVNEGSIAPSPTPTVTVVESGPMPGPVTRGLEVEVDVPYTAVVDCNGSDCVVPLDVLVPPGGEGLPTVVLVPGGQTQFDYRRYLEEFAGELARRGAVVFLPSYRSGVVYDHALDDVRCAIRYARASTQELGGDPEQLILVGHSSGSTLAIDLAVQEAAADTSCPHAGNAVPDAVVALSEFNPAVSGDAEPGPKLWFVGGVQDSLSVSGETAAQRLRDQGYAVDHRVLDTTQEGMVDPSETPEALDVVFEAARSAAGG